MDKLIESRIKKITQLCDKHMVKKLYLFGSINTKKFNKKSDVDFLISFKESLPLLDYADNYFDLQEALKQLLKRQIDLIVEKSLKNPYLIEEIDKTKSLIYG